MKKALMRHYGRAKGGMIFRASLVFVAFAMGLVVALTLVLILMKSSVNPERMAWLTVVYFPVPSEKMPKIKVYRVQADFCELQAKKLYSNFYALRTQAYCIGG